MVIKEVICNFKHSVLIIQLLQILSRTTYFNVFFSGYIYGCISQSCVFIVINLWNIHKHTLASCIDLIYAFSFYHVNTFVHLKKNCTKNSRKNIGMLYVKTFFHSKNCFISNYILLNTRIVNSFVSLTKTLYEKFLL